MQDAIGGEAATPEWGAVTFLTNGAVTLDPDQRDDLDRRDVSIEETPIIRIRGAAEVQLHRSLVWSEG